MWNVEGGYLRGLNSCRNTTGPDGDVFLFIALDFFIKWIRSIPAMISADHPAGVDHGSGIPSTLLADSDGTNPMTYPAISIRRVLKHRAVKSDGVDAR